MNVADAASSPSPVLGFVLIIAGLILYFVPTIVALVRHVPNRGSVIVINVLAGWFFGIGWVVALAMACRSHPQPAGPVSITRRGHGVNT